MLCDQTHHLTNSNNNNLPIVLIIMPTMIMMTPIWTLNIGFDFLELLRRMITLFFSDTDDESDDDVAMRFVFFLVLDLKYSR